MRFQRLFRQQWLIKENSKMSRFLPAAGVTFSSVLLSSYFPFKQNPEIKASIAEDKNEISIGSSEQKLRIKNLAFKGGGPKGLAYLGALEELEQSLGVSLNQVERVAGTSAGAIIAAALAVGYKPEELRQHISPEIMLSFVTEGLTEKQKLIIKKVLDKANNAGGSHLPFPKQIGILKAIGQIALHPIEGSKLLINYFNKQGLSDGQHFRNWLNDLLRDKVIETELSRELAKDANEIARKELRDRLEKEYANLTFGQLAELIEREKQIDDGHSYYKHLFIVGAQNSNESGKVIQRVSTSEKMQHNVAVEHFSDLIIADMVRESMSIPMVFTPSKRVYKKENIIIEGDKSGIDGGVLENYPYRLFDKQCYLTHPDPEKHPDEKVKNHETLGFVLYDKADMSILEWIKHEAWVIRATLGDNDATKPEAKSHYAKKLPSLHLDDPEEIPRHIFIDNCGVSLLNFNMTPEKQEELFSAGRNAVKVFSVEDREILRNLQAKTDGANKEKLKGLLKSYSVFTNINDYSPSQYYVKTHHYNWLQQNTSLMNKGVFGFSFVGIGGSGKSQFAYYAAKKYLKNCFWQAWRDGKFHDSEKRLILASQNDHQWVWNKNITRPVVWIFDAANPDYLWESLCSLAAKLDNENYKIDKGYEKKFQEINAKNKPSESHIRKLQQEMHHHSGFLWIFDDVTEEVKNNKLGLNTYIPSQRMIKGRVWLTTQLSSLRASDPNFQELSFNDGMNLNEAKKLLTRFTGYTDAKAKDIDAVIHLLEKIPLSVVISGAYIRSNKLTYRQFIDRYQKYDQELETEFELLTPNEANKKKLRSMKTTVSLALQSLFAKSTDSKPSHADFLQFCSKLHGEKIEEILLRDYIKMLNPGYSEDKIKKHLHKMVRESMSLLEGIITDNETTYRMHQITQSIINGEWQAVDKEILSVEKYNLAIKDSLKVLTRQFNEQGILEEEKFKHNQSLLPHVNKVLSFYPELSAVADMELIKLTLPLHKTRCFMKLSMNRAEEAGTEANMLFTAFEKHANLTGSMRKPAQIYNRLVHIDKDWPRYYAAMLYIAGRSGFYNKAISHQDKQVQINFQKQQFERCVALCEEISLRTGRQLHYKYLSERAKLRLQHNTGTLESLKNVLDSYKQLLTDNTNYYDDQENVVRFDTDKFNQLVCQEHAGQICLELAKNLSTTESEEAAKYFKTAEEYLLKNVLLIEIETSGTAFEVAARYYNSLAFLYLEPRNPHRNLHEARKYFRIAYDIESAKNDGKGKRDIYLADSCYGLASIAKELGLYSQAKRCALMSKEIIKQLNGDFARVDTFLQAIVEEEKDNLGKSSSTFFKQPSDIKDMILEQLECKNCLHP